MISSSARTNLGLFVLRVGIGLIAMFYGSQKMLGLFGGSGLHGTVEWMKSQYGIPPVLAIAAMSAELIGGGCLVLGLFTHFAAFCLACTMGVAIFETWKDPKLFEQLFSHGTPAVASQVFYAPSLFLGAFALMMLGGGAFGLDGRLFSEKKKKPKGK